TKGEQSDLTLPFRATSQISIGDPVVAVLEPTSATASQVWPQLADFEFHQVELACSFAAAAGCRFTDARFSVVLHTGWNDGGQRPGEAIAYDLFPVLLEDAQTVTVPSTAKPEVSFCYEPVSATLSLPSREKISEQVRYSSRVAAFDLRGTCPGWTF